MTDLLMIHLNFNPTEENEAPISVAENVILFFPWGNFEQKY